MHIENKAASLDIQDSSWEYVMQAASKCRIYQTHPPLKLSLL